MTEDEIDGKTLHPRSKMTYMFVAEKSYVKNYFCTDSPSFSVAQIRIFYHPKEHRTEAVIIKLLSLSLVSLVSLEYWSCQLGIYIQ